MDTHRQDAIQKEINKLNNLQQSNSFKNCDSCSCIKIGDEVYTNKNGQIVRQKPHDGRVAGNIVPNI